jgi:hypothetical protein
MNTKECDQRASECAQNAALSIDEAVAIEFLRMAALWRAMAVRQIFLGHVADPTDPPMPSNALALRAD